jgi:hypothetical protein
MTGRSGARPNRAGRTAGRSHSRSPPIAETRSRFRGPRRPMVAVAPGDEDRRRRGLRAQGPRGHSPFPAEGQPGGDGVIGPRTWQAALQQDRRRQQLGHHRRQRPCPASACLQIAIGGYQGGRPLDHQFGAGLLTPLCWLVLGAVLVSYGLVRWRAGKSHLDPEEGDENRIGEIRERRRASWRL